MAQTIAEHPRLLRVPLTPKLALMTDQPKARAQVTDPTGLTVASNVRRIRERRGLSTYQVSRQLRQVEQGIAPSALGKIERGERRVTVGELTALAAVLNVSPSALLLPLDDDPAHSIEITGAGSVPADVAWDWMDGRRPLHIKPGDSATDMLEHNLYARPPGHRIDETPLRDPTEQELSMDPRYRQARALKSQEGGAGDGPGVD
jgi:transcriptional regulator with XRE-family HTH domain